MNKSFSTRKATKIPCYTQEAFIYRFGSSAVNIFLVNAGIINKIPYFIFSGYIYFIKLFRWIDSFIYKSVITNCVKLSECKMNISILSDTCIAITFYNESTSLSLNHSRIKSGLHTASWIRSIKDRPIPILKIDWLIEYIA